MGFRRADTMRDALEMAEQVVGPRPVADALPLPAAVLRRGRSVRFAAGGRTLERLAGANADARASRRRALADGHRRPGPVGRARRRGRGVAARAAPGAACARSPSRRCCSPPRASSRMPTVIGAERPHPRAAAGDPRAQPRERHRHAARAARAAARLALAHRRRRGQRPLLPQARLRDRRGLLDQHVPVRPRRRPAPRPRRGRRAPARRPQRPALPAGHPRRRPGGLPRRRRRARARPPARRSSRSTSRAPRWSCPRAAASTAARSTTVTFARPLHPRPGETPAELTARLQAAIEHHLEHDSRQRPQIVFVEAVLVRIVPTTRASLSGPDQQSCA